MTPKTKELPQPTATHAMALNLAAWMGSSLRPYDVATETTDSIWWRQPGASGIYLGALTIADHASDAELHADFGLVTHAWQPKQFGLYDCWASRDLNPLGFKKIVQNPWYLRPAEPLSVLTIPAGLSINVVTAPAELAAFEEASRLGFGDTETVDPTWKRFAQHHPDTLADPQMSYLVGLLDGQIVSSIITHVTDGMVGIYGLSTLPSFRRRGYAAALVHAAVARDPECQACVFPDPDSVPIYTRIGFEPAGEIAFWMS